MNYSKIVTHTPCYVIDKGLLKKNLEILADISQRSGCEILLALKGFAMFSTFPLLKKYLSGTSAASMNEARLGFEEFGPEVHTCAPAYREEEIDALLGYSSHLIFNSFSQWDRWKEKALASGEHTRFGLRVNPEHSEVKVPIYDPCSPGSRLGIRAPDLKGKCLEGISGLHFHALCELNSDSLARTLAAVESKFGEILPEMDWVNFGGGHHITREDYDRELLVRLIRDFRDKYNVEVFLEPGEAIALNAGFLVASVLDIIRADRDIAILDTSAAAHMPDVLEMPYRPGIIGGADPGEKAYTCRLGGMTCLAGDIIGEYSFDLPLQVGDRLVFTDMAHYTMVKNNTFNGIGLPSIEVYDPGAGESRVVRRFGYEDYRNRLS